MTHAEQGDRTKAVQRLQAFLERAGLDTPESMRRQANDTLARIQDVI
jgi:hypothetical protein